MYPWRFTVISIMYNYIFFHRQQVLEQERRDRELALRLASEDQNEVEDVVVPPLQR